MVGLGTKDTPRTSRPQGARVILGSMPGRRDGLSSHSHWTLSPGNPKVALSEPRVCDSPLHQDSPKFQEVWQRINASYEQPQCVPISHLCFPIPHSVLPPKLPSCLSAHVNRIQDVPSPPFLTPILASARTLFCISNYNAVVPKAVIEKGQVDQTSVSSRRNTWIEP